MNMIHEEAPEVRQFPGKGKYISFIFISMLQSCQLLFFWRRTCVVIISRVKLPITVKRLIPTLSYFREEEVVGL